VGANIPRDITVKEIKVPTAPNSVIVMKLRKNCFFFTWNLVKEKTKKKENCEPRFLVFSF
jgi:hypothetical protein